VQDLDGDFRQQLQPPLAVTGAVITDVDGGSNSSIAGLRQGDVITEINHQTVANAEDAVRLCKAAKSDQILVKIWRRNGELTVNRYISVSNTKHAK
jgi:S1-C subfamily serine protease